MYEQPSMDQPRRIRVVKLRHVVLACLATALLVGGGIAYADFSDVPISNPFYDEIGWMEDTGISTGYSDGTFRPNEPVKRQAMSAFMARLYNVQAGLHAIVSTTDEYETTSATYVDLPGASVVVTIPPGTTGRIVGRFGAETTCANGDSTSWCSVQLTRNGTAMLPDEGTMNAFDAVADASAPATDAFEANATIQYTPVLGPGTYTIKARIATNHDGTAPEFRLDNWTLEAEVYLEDVTL